MNKFLFSLIFLVLSTCSGCSLLPRLTFDKPGVTPTSTERTNARTQCAGELKINKETGEIVCTKGYYSNEQNSKVVERTYTLAEKIGNWIRALSFWWLLILIAVVILCPGFLGWLIGATFNAAKTALTATVKAIGAFKSKIPTVVIDGKEVADPNYAKIVDALLDELENEHSKDPSILKTISDIRVQLKVADND